MGYFDKGKWQKEVVNPKTESGEFIRQQQAFRSFLNNDAKAKFPVESYRYHLIVSYACPWAHRVLIARALKGLESIISLSVVSPFMLDWGWTFQPDFEGVSRNNPEQAERLASYYLLADPEFSGRVTVPVLWDLKTKTIVNNESSDILRIFNSSFNTLTGNETDLYPSDLTQDIEKINEFIYLDINDGVYKTGFATSQEAYEAHFRRLFHRLDALDQLLEGKDYLFGARLTESDIRLFTTLIRFDEVYYVHFKCNYRLIREYKNLNSYIKRLLEIPAFRDTTHMNHIKAHYYGSHKTLNPSGIIPLGRF